MPDFLFFDRYFMLVLNLLDALFLDRTGSFFLLLCLAVTFADPFLGTLGGDAEEDALVDPGDAAAANSSMGVVAAASTDALVMVVVVKMV